MQKIILPKSAEWPKLSLRPRKDAKDLTSSIQKIFEEVKTKGDKAIKSYMKKSYKLASELRVTEQELSKSGDHIAIDLLEAMDLAKNNIKFFHQNQKFQEDRLETMPGVKCWRESRPISAIGIYVPASAAPVFSKVLMFGIPASIAGCSNIVLCTPPNADGDVHPALLHAAKITGINKIFKVEGAYAIAAMTFGTESIPKVEKIFGNGDEVISFAKREALSWGVSLDLPQESKELLIIADEHCNPAYVAADLLAFAEYGEDSQLVLMATDEKIVNDVLSRMAEQIKSLPKKDTIFNAIENSKAIVMRNLEGCIRFSNLYGPENLVLACATDPKLTSKITTAGSVYIGNLSCESVGNFITGTNNNQPSGGFAKNSSGISLDDFVKKVTFQQVSQKGMRSVGPSTEVLAEGEQMFAHINAVNIRLTDILHDKQAG